MTVSCSTPLPITQFLIYLTSIFTRASGQLQAFERQLSTAWYGSRYWGGLTWRDAVGFRGHEGSRLTIMYV